MLKSTRAVRFPPRRAHLVHGGIFVEMTGESVPAISIHVKIAIICESHGVMETVGIQDTSSTFSKTQVHRLLRRRLMSTSVCATGCVDEGNNNSALDDATPLFADAII